MARTIRHAKLDTRTARKRLQPGRQAHYQSLITNRAHLGYQRHSDEASGHWLLRRNDDGKYSTRTLATADDVSRADGVSILSYEQAKSAALAALEAPRHGRLTVRQAMADYIGYQTARGKNTNDLERRTVVHILPTLGDLEVAALTTEKLRKWLAGIASAPVRRHSSANGHQAYGPAVQDDEAIRRRRSSANRVANYLRSALSFAHVEGKVSNADAWGRRWKRFEGVEQARLRYLTLEEASRFLAGCDHAFRLLARGALETGMRYGELCRLAVSNFNPDVGTVLVRKAKSNRPRHIVLTPEGSAFFRSVTVGRPGDARIFTRASGEPWGESDQGRQMRRACERAALHPAVNFHALRHSWASLATMNGMPLAVVAAQLGHASVRVTERNYAHLSPSYIAEAVRAGAPRFVPNLTAVAS